MVGWDNELTGIWVSKFEAGFAQGDKIKASSVGYTQATAIIGDTESGNTQVGIYEIGDARNWLDGIYGSDEVLIKYPIFQPIAYSMNYISENDAYELGKVLTENNNIYGLNKATTDSHMIKNSEWGAVAYLALSKYGSAEKITANDANLDSGNQVRTVSTGRHGVDSVYAITGCTTGETVPSAMEDGVETTVSALIDTAGNIPTEEGVYVWNQLNGQKASTTGNIYGVYDMNGGLRERTANFITSSDARSLLNNGKELLYDTQINGEYEGTKYVSIYEANTVSDRIRRWNIGKNINIC